MTPSSTGYSPNSSIDRTPGRLRIAMLSVHSCPLGKLGGVDTGGMSVYIVELARELGTRGHLVDVYTRAHGLGHEAIVALGKNVRLIHLKAGQEDEIDKLAIYPHLAEFACEVEDFRQSCGLRYDLVHSHYWLSGWVGRWLHEWWKVPHVTMMHTLGAVKNAVGTDANEPALRIDCEGQVTVDCQRVIVATGKEKEDLIYHYGVSPETVAVIPCGVNLDLFRPINSEIARRHLGFDGQRIVLFVGRIVPVKGIDKLLLAMSYLENNRNKLIVIGGDERSQAEMERLKSLSRSLELDHAVVFLGLINQGRLPYYYSAADVCVIPSYYETFGLVALESMACGTPVVATRVGGMDSVIRQGETGYVVDDNTPHHLAEKIDQLLGVPRRKDIDSIRAAVTGFSWSHVATAMSAEYQAVVSDYQTQIR